MRVKTRIQITEDWLCSTVFNYASIRAFGHHLSGFIYTTGLGLTKAVSAVDLAKPKLDGHSCPASSPSQKLPRVLIHRAQVPAYASGHWAARLSPSLVTSWDTLVFRLNGPGKGYPICHALNSSLREELKLLSASALRLKRR